MCQELQTLRIVAIVWEVHEALSPALDKGIPALYSLITF